jgi:hypothetical protein
MKPIPFPGHIGESIRLPAMLAVSDPPSAEPFRVGDVCTFPPFPYQFRVTRIDGDDVTFKRIS